MLYNPLYKQFKSITGAVPANKKLTIRVKGDFGSVVLLLRKDGHDFCMRFPMQKESDQFITNLQLDRGLYFYYFEIDCGKFIGKGNYYSGEITEKPCEYQLTVYDKDYTTPEWFKGGIIYQIFPDRFCKSQAIKQLPQDKVFRKNWGETPYFSRTASGSNSAVSLLPANRTWVCSLTSCRESLSPVRR